MGRWQAAGCFRCHPAAGSACKPVALIPSNVHFAKVGLPEASPVVQLARKHHLSEARYKHLSRQRDLTHWHNKKLLLV